MMNVLTDACIPHPASMGNTLYRIPWRADKTSGGFQFFFVIVFHQRYATLSFTNALPDGPQAEQEMSKVGMSI